MYGEGLALVMRCPMVRKFPQKVKKTPHETSRITAAQRSPRTMSSSRCEEEER